MHANPATYCNVSICLTAVGGISACAENARTKTARADGRRVAFALFWVSVAAGSGRHAAQVGRIRGW